MGATFETMTVKATTAKEAAVKIINSSTDTDPYSGWFNTCSEFVDKTYKMREDDFEDWVLDNGEKRVLYLIKMSTTTYLGCAWCAC
jgi:hypothetical protein